MGYFIPPIRKTIVSNVITFPARNRAIPTEVRQAPKLFGTPARQRRQRAPSPYLVHTVTVEDMVFECFMTLGDGPTLAGYRSGEFSGSVPLGVARVFDVDGNHRAVCKYDSSQPRIDVSSLSLSGLQQLHEHFAVPFWPSTADGKLEAALVYASLQRWAHEHPKLLAQVSHTSRYVGRWLAAD